MHQTAYQPRGMNVGLGMGAVHPGGSSCKTMVQWQGTGEYFYWPHISAGATVRFYGGNLDDNYALMYQRYHLHARVHFSASDNFDFYVSPIVGFETTDLSKIREDKTADGFGNDTAMTERDFSSGCRDEYSLNGFSAGWETGFGWTFLPDWAWMEMVGLDYNFSRVGQLSITSGLAFNLHNHVNFLKSPFLGSWLSLEFLLYHHMNAGRDTWGRALVLGFNLNI